MKNLLITLSLFVPTLCYAQTLNYQVTSGSIVSNEISTPAKECITKDSKKPISVNFQIQQADLSGPARLLAGQLPSYHTQAGPHGSVVLTKDFIQTKDALSLQKQSHTGTILISLDRKQNTASGSISINPGMINISSDDECISIANIALDVVYLDNSKENGTDCDNAKTGLLANALVIVYLSNGQVLYPLVY